MISCKHLRTGFLCLFFSASSVPGPVSGVWLTVNQISELLIRDSPFLISHPRTLKIFIPLAICHSCLDHQRLLCVRVILPLLFRTLNTLLSEPCTLYYHKMTCLSLHTHLSTSPSNSFSFTLVSVISFSVISEGKKMSFFAEQRLTRVLTYPILWGVEQTALKYDLDLNPL